MRRLTILIIVILCGLAALGYFYVPKIKNALAAKGPGKEEEQVDIAKVQVLLSQSKPQEALEIIKKYEGVLNFQTERGKQWLDLLITASEEAPSPQELYILHEYFPEAFNNHEKGAQIVANMLLMQNKGPEYIKLREKWKGNEKEEDVWFVLDADKMLIDGNRKEAESFLNSKTFPGKKDSNRLIRLAFLTVNENPKQAWDYLTEAQTKDPTNPDIRLYRARLLEALGEKQYSFAEYIAAAQVAKENPVYQDQLAEFLIRNHSYVEAIDIWTYNLGPKTPDIIWLKAWFWNKVGIKSPVEWKVENIPDSPLKPLLTYLFNLKPDQYWDQAAFDKIPNNTVYIKEQPVTFWLRLIQSLKEGDEKNAEELLKLNLFAEASVLPSLELALQRVLNYRINGTLLLEDIKEVEISKTYSTQLESTQGNQPQVEWKSPFFEELESLAAQQRKDPNFQLPQDVKALLESKEAFSVVFLAATWIETSLFLHQLAIIPPNFPNWVVIGLTQALQIARGNSEALKFATMQKPTPELILLVAQLLMAEKNLDAAIEQLKPLAKEDNDIGKSASLLMSLIYLEKQDFPKAREMINSQPALKSEIVGQETLAKIALFENNEELADRIYTNLGETSAEARSYLARKAALKKDWKNARRLTEQLIMEYPSNLMLRENLKYIDEEEKKGSRPSLFKAKELPNAEIQEKK